MKISPASTKSYICFDWGTRYIGVAVSPDGKHVFDREPIECGSEESGIEKMVHSILKEQSAHVVFGLPLALSGQEGRMAIRVRSIAEKVKKRTRCRISFQDERMTSRGSVRIPSPQKQRHHSIAAAHILETFLGN